MTQALPRLLPVSADMARSLLASDRAGRLTRCDPALAAIPVQHHLLDDGQLILRAQRPAPASRFAFPRRLTYQVDQINMRDHTGWTVIVTGLADQITGTRLRHYRARLGATATVHAEHFLLIHPQSITGYRLTRDAW